MHHSLPRGNGNAEKITNSASRLKTIIVSSLLHHNNFAVTLTSIVINLIEDIEKKIPKLEQNSLEKE